jgi:hypothetical protein
MWFARHRELAQRVLDSELDEATYARCFLERD